MSSFASPTSSPTSNFERHHEAKCSRKIVRQSLEDFFAIHPKYQYCESDNGAGDTSPLSNATSRISQKSVRFADNIIERSGFELPFLEFNTSNRSLTSISEESISLDSTQHCSRCHGYVFKDEIDYDHTHPSKLPTTYTTPRIVAGLDQTTHGSFRPVLHR